MAAFVGVLLFAVPVGGVGMLIHSSSTRRKQERDGALGMLVQHLSGHRESGDTVSGALHGVATTVRFTSRGSGSSSEAWTEIDCVLPPGYPLSLDVRRHGWFD